jgi:cytoskeletal protein CcmA (bactofilin family)
MFNQSADAPATDQSPDPIGMRELPPQPARPVMPAYTLPTPTGTPRVEQPSGPGPEDSVVARDDHFDGTFTSRGTVVVMGSVKGRIEAVRLRIEAGAQVDAEVIVDEAIVAGEFTGTLTCRERLEARSSGRINGRVETYKLMLHEGASVEGEMHMLTERPRDASETIRGSAPLRGEAKPTGRTEAAASGGPAAHVSPATPAAATAPTAPADPSASVVQGSPAAPITTAAATRPAPIVTPSSSAKTGRGTTHGTAVGSTATLQAPASTATPTARASSAPSVEAILAQRSTAAQMLRLDSPPLMAPRTTSSARPSSAARPTASTSGVAGGTSGARSKGTTTGF